MKSNEFIKQFKIWLVMENILDIMEHYKLSGDCEMDYPVGPPGLPALEQNPFSENMYHEEQNRVLKELKEMGAIYFSDPASKIFSVASALSFKKTIQIKSNKFDRVYKDVSKIFYSLGEEERTAITDLNKDDLESCKKFLDIVAFYLKHADGMRNGKCQFLVYIPFSDFGDIANLEIFKLAEKIENLFKTFVLPKALRHDYLMLAVYSKAKVDELLKAIEQALEKAKDDAGKKNIREIVIVDSGSKAYKLVINGDYKNCLEPSQGRKYWELFLQTAQNIPLEKENYKGYFDYINSNKNNPFIKAGYGKSKLLTVKDGYILPNVPIEIISEKAFKERMNKQNKT